MLPANCADSYGIRLPRLPQLALRFASTPKLNSMHVLTYLKLRTHLGLLDDLQTPLVSTPCKQPLQHSAIAHAMSSMADSLA